MHRFNWDDLRFLLAVAEQGTLSGAARTLGVNHATVHRRVRDFEKTLGISIFRRAPNGYELTAETWHIMDMLRSVERSVEGFERSISGLATDIQGTVRLTSTDSLCEAVLVHHVRDLAKLYPGVLVDLRVDNNPLDLSKLDADITVRPAKTQPSDLSGEKAGELSLRVYGARSYLSKNGSARPEDHDWLGLLDRLERSPAGQWMREVAGGSIVFRSNSFLTLRDAAVAGMGLAMLPAYLGDVSERLVRVPAFNEDLRTNIWVATHPDRRSARLELLMAYFANAIARDQPLLTGEPEPALSA